jgi:hypothetical protein
MKYLKNFEKLHENKYKVGDYILINIDFIKKHNFYNTFYSDFTVPFGRITDVDYILFNPYTVSIIYENAPMPDRSGIDAMCLRDDEIIRHLTPDEIDEFESKKTALKYNL